MSSTGARQSRASLRFLQHAQTSYRSAARPSQRHIFTSSSSTSSSAASTHTPKASTSNSGNSIAGGALAQILRDNIRATGPMPLSRYMQFCLSHPTEGYYQRGDVFGRKGDFITSPEISQVFGEMMGIWLLSRWLASISAGSRGDVKGQEGVRLVELGPGRGTLMDDILRTLTNFPTIANEIKSIHLVENSAKMRDVQQAKLAARLEGKGIKVEWHGHIDEVPERDDLFTMLIAHEFFDAMPINLFEKRESGYREVLVDTDPSFTPGLSTGNTSGLRLALSPDPTPLSQVLPSTSPRFANLPVGSRIEVAQDSYRIARRCGELISGQRGGAGLVVDYGGDRAYGDSFRAFRNHKLANVFDSPGSSDLTANVDFAYLKEALQGVARPLGPLSQMQFLLSLGMGTRVDKLIDTAKTQERKDDISNSAKRLVDPLGMGAQYQVMGIAPKLSNGASGDEEGQEEVYPFISQPVPTETPASA